MTSLNAALFTAINKYAASTEETRYYLAGVCLDVQEDGKAFMVATDGNTLLVAPFVNSYIPVGRYIIPRTLIEKIKAKKNDKRFVTVTIVKEKVSLIFDNESFSGELIDGTFPDWRRVIPKGDMSGEAARHSGARLKALEDAAKAVGAQPPLVGLNGWNPCIVEFPGAQLFGVVMPEIQSRSPDPKWPDFL